jgi:hypothetical protein
VRFPICELGGLHAKVDSEQRPEGGATLGRIGSGRKRR